MKFTELKIQNFMSVSNVSTRLDDRGLILIQGENVGSDAFSSNGSGKSTIFSEAICWCLFSETIRGYKANEVVNNKANGNTMVSITIQDGTDTYVVSRYRKHTEHKNAVLLYKNGENITAKSDTDTTKLIEDLLQIDFMSFTNSVLFGQGISKKFASSTDAEQKKILERMLQIDILKSCQDLAKKYFSSIQSSIEEKKKDILHLTSKRATFLQAVEELQEKESELGENVRNNIEQAREELKDLQDQLEKLGTVDDLEEIHKKILKESSELDKEIEEFQPVEDELHECRMENKALELFLKGLAQEINALIDEAEEVESGKAKPKVCKHCGQVVPTDDPVKLLQHLNSLILEKNNDYDEIEVKKKKYEEKIDKLSKVIEGKKPLMEKRTKIIQGMAEVRMEIRNHERTSESLKGNIKGKEKYIREQEQLLSTTYTDLIEQNVRDAENVQSEIDITKEQIDNLTKELSLYEFWINAYGNQGIKSIMLDGITPFLNTRANYYLGKLSDNTMSVLINTQTELKSGEKRDKFCIEVQNDLGSSDYRGCSGGEKQRMDVAINMALQDLILSRSNKKIDFLVLDEAFEALDVVGCEKVIELLKEKANMFGSVFVITHNASLAEHFSTSITVRKSDSGVTLIE